MGRKIIAVLLLVCVCANFCTIAHAESYTVYEGNPSSTYIQYFRDLMSKVPLNTHYVAFRSGQNDYLMVVGDLDFNGSKFTSSGECKVYSFSSNSSNYNSYYSFDSYSISNVDIKVNDYIIYSDLGDYPELETKGEKYESLTTLVLFIALLMFIISRIFSNCLRRR